MAFILLIYISRTDGTAGVHFGTSTRSLIMTTRSCVVPYPFINMGAVDWQRHFFGRLRLMHNKFKNNGADIFSSMNTLRGEIHRLTATRFDRQIWAAGTRLRAIVFPIPFPAGGRAPPYSPSRLSAFLSIPDVQTWH